MNTQFLYFIKELIVNPKDIFLKYLKGQQGHPPYFSALVAIYGIGSMIDQLQQQFLQYDVKGDITTLEPLNNWQTFWGASIIFGFVSGLISYYVGGWFFNIRLRLSKGDSDLQTSRSIFLYSRVIFSFAILFIALIKTLTTPIPYYHKGEFTSWDLGFIMIALTFMYQSCYVGYIGVRTLTNADKTKSILWFIILPMFLYVFALFSLITLMYDIHG